MAFFDKISEMAKNVGDKTGDMIEVTKLGGQISDAEKRIVDQKKAIGEYCWTQYIANIQLDPEIAKMCASIKSDEELIARTQAEVRSIKADKAAAPVVVEAGMLRCQECETPNPEGTRFCQNCGAELKISAPAAPVEVATCPACGFQNSVGTRFCQECGTDMTAPVGEKDISAGEEAAPPGDGRLCPACGAVNKEENRFCMECGTTLPVTPAAVPPTEPGGLFCPACGAVNKEGNRFCMECGTTLPVLVSFVEPAPVEEPAKAPPVETIAEEPAFERNANPAEEMPLSEELVVEVPTPVPSICPACGTKNRPGVKFCGECGARLEG